MRYTVVISEDALAMLDNHVEFLARVSVEAAKRTADRLLADISSLSELPERCPYYDNRFVPKGRYRRLLSSKRYMILFEVQGDAVFVDYVIDCRCET